MFELLNYKIKNLNAKCVDLPVTYFLHLASLFQIFDCLLHHITVGSNPKNKYMYEILVETGPMASHATTSKIQFILTGEKGDTGVRTFNQPLLALFTKKMKNK